MNKKLKRKWVAALRGGTYKQCFGSFHKDGAHCALGVLTEVQIESGMLDDRSLPAGHGLAVMGLNDVEKMSFGKIADWIEEHL